MYTNIQLIVFPTNVNDTYSQIMRKEIEVIFTENKNVCSINTLSAI